jgi:AAA domain (dynein-related subfamily)
MNPRLTQLVQALSMAALAWFGFQLLNRVHPLLVIGLVLVAAGNVALLWMLRFDRDRLAALYAQPYAKQYLNWVCHWAGEQPPLPPPTAAPQAEFLLHSDDDFRNACWRAKQVVFGHDEVVDRLLWGIRDAMALRKRRRESSGQPPLGSFLLVGGEGIGKRYLARVMAKLLYRDGSVLAFECDKLPHSSLLGTPGHTGELLQAVRRQPCQLILLERIDAAPPIVLQEIQNLLTRGSCRDPSTGREVSFQNTILVMTTTKSAGRLAAVTARSLTDRAWREQAVEALCSETGIDRTVLHAAGGILLCQQPTDYVLAKVTAQLMLKECAVHGVNLQQVDPLILASRCCASTRASALGGCRKTSSSSWPSRYWRPANRTGSLCRYVSACLAPSPGRIR